MNWLWNYWINTKQKKKRIENEIQFIKTNMHITVQDKRNHIQKLCLIQEKMKNPFILKWNRK